MKIKEKYNLKDKNNSKIKRQVSIITVFLWIFLIATMVTIVSGNIKKTNALSGSETISLGTSGNNSWTETIVYHSNYPNGSEDTWTVNYKITSSSSYYVSGLKNFNQIGFRVPEEYTLKSGWYTYPSGGSSIR